MRIMLEIGDRVMSNYAHSVISSMFGDFIYDISLDVMEMKDEEDLASNLIYTMGEIVANMIIAGEITLNESLLVSKELSNWVHSISDEELLEVLQNNNT